MSHSFPIGDYFLYFCVIELNDGFHHFPHAVKIVVDLEAKIDTCKEQDDAGNDNKNDLFCF